MSNLSEYSVLDNSDFFANVHLKTPLKTFAIIINTILSILVVWAGYGIIWYERYGTDLKRTLINRLLSSACWTGIEFYVLVMPWHIFRYVIGPFNTNTCFLLLLFKNILNAQTFLFGLGVSISRYVYIFYLKNPEHFQDQFWQTFVNIWVVSCGILSQGVFVLLPGRQPTSFSLCTGQVLYYYLHK